MWKVIRMIVPALLALGAVYLFFLVLPALGAGGRTSEVEIMARSQFALRAAAQVAGLLVTFSASLVLLQRATSSEASGDLLVPGMGLLGGVLLFESHWAIAVSFAVLALAQVVERVIASRRGDQVGAARGGD